MDEGSAIELYYLIKDGQSIDFIRQWLKLQDQQRISDILNFTSHQGAAFGHNDAAVLLSVPPRRDLSFYRLFAIEGGDWELKDRWLQAALHHASMFGTCQTVQYLVEDLNADISKGNIDGKTALMLASRHGQLQIVEYLLKAGRYLVNHQDRYGHTALIDACQKGHYEIVVQLVKLGLADCDISNKKKTTALMVACDNGRLDIVRFLLEHTGYIAANNVDDYGLTALIYATTSGSLELVQYLVEDVGVDLNFCCEVGVDVLYFSADDEISEYLIKHGAC